MSEQAATEQQTAAPMMGRTHTDQPGMGIVTIDGVAASGKSSVSSGVAQALGVPYVSSGLLYRAVTLLGLESGVELHDSAALLELLERHAPRLEPLAEGNRVWWNDQDRTDDLHSSAVDAGVSVVAVLPQVRAWVDARLQELPPPFVAEGRDMGTNVFPQAAAKFYLTASPRIRAERRARERPEDVPAIEAALTLRDAKDHLQSAPAADAHLIDTGPLTLEGVVQTILTALNER